MFSMGRTCLHVAAQAGALAALTCLVNIHRLDVMTVTVSQMTALHCAAKEGHIATVRWLLEQGVPVNDRCVFCLTEGPNLLGVFCGSPASSTVTCQVRSLVCNINCYVDNR